MSRNPSKQVWSSCSEPPVCVLFFLTATRRLVTQACRFRTHHREIRRPESGRQQRDLQKFHPVISYRRRTKRPPPPELRHDLQAPKQASTTSIYSRSVLLKAKTQAGQKTRSEEPSSHDFRAFDLFQLEMLQTAVEGTRTARLTSRVDATESLKFKARKRTGVTLRAARAINLQSRPLLRSPRPLSRFRGRGRCQLGS